MVNTVQIRDRLGWNQRDLALHLGCSQAMVCRIEQGAKPNGPVARLLALWVADATSGRIPVKQKSRRGRPHMRADARPARARATS